MAIFHPAMLNIHYFLNTVPHITFVFNFTCLNILGNARMFPLSQITRRSPQANELQALIFRNLIILTKFQISF